VVAVVVFLGVTLGLRPALVVSIAIPLTLALTLFISMLIGYSINRVTLFALIFSIGILVDDAIVVVENTYRHLTLRIRPHREASLFAVDEVGNPTILATLTVIAALLPMAFVSGLMGPYMRPIPVNASIAMFVSLLVAFIVIPWFCQTCYRPGVHMAGVDHESFEAAAVIACTSGSWLRCCPIRSWPTWCWRSLRSCWSGRLRCSIPGRWW
jgi:multidrug efflux pump subunit AcrB